MTEIFKKATKVIEVGVRRLAEDGALKLSTKIMY
jgi:hypothetical protein